MTVVRWILFVACAAAAIVTTAYLAEKPEVGRTSPNRSSSERPRETSTPNRPSGRHFAFVLIDKGRLPDPNALSKAYARYAGEGSEARFIDEETDERVGSSVAEYRLDTGQLVMIAFMPIAVPDGEAEAVEERSVAVLKGGPRPKPHEAQLVVMFHGSSAQEPLAAASRFIKLVAAVAEASSAVGVYWGQAGVTHEASYFCSTALRDDDAERVSLLIGVDRSSEADGRTTLRSTGLELLGLPEFLLVSNPKTESDPTSFYLNVLTYLADRGEGIADGETVGRTAEEKFVVRRVPSPTDPRREVMRVEIP